MTTITKLFDEATIALRIEELAKEIGDTLKGEFIIIGLLKGSFVFVADLIRALDHSSVSPEVDFIWLSSYGLTKESSGTVELIGKLPADIAGKHVLLVDDIIDTGLSLAYAIELLLKEGVSGISTCVMIDKPYRREIDLSVDFTGFDVDDVFIVGYGIDFAGKYRQLPYIGTVD